MNEPIISDIAIRLSRMEADLGALLQAQQISNLLAVSNNVNVPAETQQMALASALQMMGLAKSRAAEAFLDDELPSRGII